MSTPIAGRVAQQKSEGKTQNPAFALRDDFAAPDLHAELLALQQSAGNQAVHSLVEGNLPPIVQTALSTSGQPLEPGLRQQMESRFGHDFSEVRVHTDSQGEQSARAIRAKAYTVGNDIVFGEGRYEPETGEGKRLIAHELVHVVQQGRGGSAPPLDPSSSLEQAAAAAAIDAVQTDGLVQVCGASGPGLACDWLDDLRKDPVGKTLGVL
jgi:hypothetical protein